jgi:hypothetical protein
VAHYQYIVPSEKLRQTRISTENKALIEQLRAVPNVAVWRVKCDIYARIEQKLTAERSDHDDKQD